MRPPVLSWLRASWHALRWGRSRPGPSHADELHAMRMKRINLAQLHKWQEAKLQVPAPDVTYYVGQETLDGVARALDCPDAACDDRILIVRKSSTGRAHSRRVR